MPAIKWSAIFVCLSAIAASPLAPVVANAAAIQPAGAIAAPAAPIATLTPGAGLATAPLTVETGPRIETAQYVGPRRGVRRGPRYRRGWNRRPYAWRRPVRVVRRPPVVVRPWVAAPVIAAPVYAAPVGGCGRRVVRVRRGGRIVTTVVRCSPVAYGPVFYGGRYVRY